MKMLVLTSLAAIALAGCNTPNHMVGRLAVKAPIKIKTKRDKVVTIAPATYKATLDIEGNSTEVDIHTSNGKHSFIVPGIRPDQHGNINIPASKLGQEFGLSGKIYESTSDFDRTTSESCVHHYDHEHRCHSVPHCVRDAAGGVQCDTREECNWERVPVHGTQPVQVEGSQSTKNASINLVKAGKAIGAFHASYAYREKIHSRRVVGSCDL
jgi:hypothetical protein